jgi:hypothetical protein
MTGVAVAMQIWADGPLGLQALPLACLAQNMPLTRSFRNVLHAPPETAKVDAEIEKTNQARRIFVDQSQGRKNTCSSVLSRTDPSTVW